VRCGSGAGAGVRTGAGRSVSRMGLPMSPMASQMVCQGETGHAARMSDDAEFDESQEPEFEEAAEPEPGDVRTDIVKELARLFPDDRMQRIGDRLGLSGDEDFQFVIDLISATFTRGIEFGAIEVSAQQIEAGLEISPTVEIAHVDLP
jgi:hypothetical protein